MAFGTIAYAPIFFDQLSLMSIESDITPTLTFNEVIETFSTKKGNQKNLILN